MIITAHQPTYIPWLGLFNKIELSEKFIFLDNLQYEKNSWQNRNKIKTIEGNQWLTIPVHGHINLNCNQIKIDNKKRWAEKHLKSIKMNYEKTEYFKNYIEFLEDFFSRRWENLAKLNEYLLKWLLKELEIKTEFYRASDFSFKGQKSDLILNICKEFNAKIFIFGECGKSYADIEELKKNGIKPVFQKYQHPIYKQQYGEFQMNLSIIDLIFNCGKDSKKILMNKNTIEKFIN